MSLGNPHPALVLLASCVIVFGGLLLLGGLGERDHRQRSRVSDAFGSLHEIYDAFPRQLSESDRGRLGLPKKIRREYGDVANEMPSSVHYTIDVVGSSLVATFDDDQEAISGLTIFLSRSGATGSPFKCGGTTPQKFLPVICRQ